MHPRHFEAFAPLGRRRQNLRVGVKSITTKLRALIVAGNGTATLNTVEGGKLWLMMNGSSNILLKDEKGDLADITISDVRQSNGVIHVVHQVLMPG
jgi:uncharacterized surface protein with fasciclin (FAS1) repeats